MYKDEQDSESDDSMFKGISQGESVTLEHLNNINWDDMETYSLLVTQEETMDAATMFNQPPVEFVPYCKTGPPERTCFPGELKFEVEICGAHTKKSKYFYSELLNRIYVDMGYSFSVQFRWEAARQRHAALYVRATTVFSDQAQAEKRVTRCMQHYHETPKDGAHPAEEMRAGVLHSSRGAGAAGVHYCGGEPDRWHAVLVRLAAPTTHAYQFACKNSCTSGINRRTIAILFTLEDPAGNVLGRQMVGARVCACPKRDIQREEGEARPGKRPARPVGPRARPEPPAPPAPPPTKRIRLEVVDTDEVIQLPQIKVVGRRTVSSGLRVMLDMMEEKRAMRARSHQPTEDLDASIAQLEAHLARLNEKQK